ncbi:hypothetical protein AMTRI_Chr01g110920 [Amborella trichopoda]
MALLTTVRRRVFSVLPKRRRRWLLSSVDMSSAPCAYRRWRCLSLPVGVSTVLRVYHRRRCLPPPVGLSSTLCAYHRRRYLSPPSQGCCYLLQQCLASSRGHDTLTPWLWVATPNAAGTFLFLCL